MAPKNHAIAYGNYGRKKPPPEHFISGGTQKPNRLQKKPKKVTK